MPTDSAPLFAASVRIAHGRDRILVVMDEAQRDPSLDQYIEIMATPTNANSVLDTWRRRLVAPMSNPPSAVEQLRQANDQGEIAVYFTLSQIAAFRNFSEFYRAATGNLWPENDPAYVEASYTLFDLEKIIANLNGSNSGETTVQELILAWKNRFVIVPKPRPTVPGPGQ
ncbi:MAG: hypothetical protein U1G08_07940 [Verrucomicrobiota bacterium]